MFSTSYAAVKNILHHFIAICPPVKEVNIGLPVKKANICPPEQKMSENLIINKIIINKIKLVHLQMGWLDLCLCSRAESEWKLDYE